MCTAFAFTLNTDRTKETEKDVILNQGKNTIPNSFYNVPGDKCNKIRKY